MSTQVDTQSNVSTIGKKPAFFQVTVKGKIQASRRWGGLRHTRIAAPAVDEYSRPQVLELRSKESLGEVDDIITVTAMLGGFVRKSYKFTDKDGEVQTVTPVDMTLDVIE